MRWKSPVRELKLAKDAKVADGKTNRAVAEELCISVETVRTHVSSILSKLETPNRSAAAVKYHQLVAI